MESENDSEDGFDDDVAVVISNTVRYPFSNLTNERKRLKSESKSDDRNATFSIRIHPAVSNNDQFIASRDRCQSRSD